MKEIRRILEVYEKINFNERRAALATVVRVEGSSYRRPGARMLIMDDGRWEGAISGGCLEGDALKKARQVILDGQPLMVTYDTMDDDANSLEAGLGCNGIIDVFIEPINADEPDNPVTFLRDYVRNREVHVIATVLKNEKGNKLFSGKRFVYSRKPEESIPAWLEDDMKQVLDTGIPELKSYTLPDGLAEIFLERINPDIELIIFGAGFDVVPVLKLASELGWQVTVTEDCIAHLAPKRFSAATCIIYAERDAVLDKINITDRTAAVLMSHNYKYDIAVLEALLSTDIPYIGILGPLKRFEKMKDEYMKSGKIFSDSKLNQVHAPIGLDIGAETPDEIALSIISEIKAFFTHRPGSFLKNKKTPIHHRDEKYQ